MGKTKRFVKWASRGTTSSDAGICWRFTKNKVVESKVVFTKDFWDWFRFCTQLNRKGNQSGFCLAIDLLWFRIEFEFYDRRQWDHKKDRFLEPEPVEEPFKYF
tara:strand:- start:149 stop:457 length:309 start_codon:yes stop_codon:yes gene_type:complete